jgi:hypothetical protein
MCIPGHIPLLQLIVPVSPVLLGQARPPSTGGLLTLYVLVKVPGPQDTEHSVLFTHAPKQLTATGREECYLKGVTIVQEKCLKLELPCHLHTRLAGTGFAADSLNVACLVGARVAAILKRPGHIVCPGDSAWAAGCRALHIIHPRADAGNWES